jgi:dephospho-CoA kinase
LRARVVGLTGGIGSGKSEALRAFARHGAATLSSDEVVHELLLRQEVKRRLVERFGPAVIGPDGEVDRRRVAEIVFADDEARRWQEQLLYPLIGERFARWRDEQDAAGARLLVHEAPTLFEAGIEDRYDAILTVTAPAELRERRHAGAAQRMAHQLSEEEKAARSDYVFVNDGSLEELDRFVARIVRDLGR